MPKSKNQTFDDEKLKKANQNHKLPSKFFLVEWFGHKASEPIGFYDNILIIQRKLLFPKKNSSKLIVRRFDTPWCIFDILSAFWVQWDTMAHWHSISRW